MALHYVETKLASAWPPAAWRDVTVLLAVSGGGDSVALLRAMAALSSGPDETCGAGVSPAPAAGTATPQEALTPCPSPDGRGELGQLAVVHVNHQLRPGEAAAEEALVVDLCRHLAIRCEVERVEIDRAAGHRGQGLEGVARRIRYAAFQRVAARLGARYVVTAHTADDQAETILHRILRGTGIRGLAGMARVRPLGPATLLRPLLGIRRADLRAYLSELGQPYRDDSSNLDLQFTRNRIRNQLLPQLAEQFNAGIVDALLRLGTLAGDAQTILDRLVDDLARRCVGTEQDDCVRIELALLPSQTRCLVRELLLGVWRRQSWPMQAMGFDQWELLADMVLAGAGDGIGTPQRRMFPGGIVVEKEENGDFLLIRRG